MQPGGIPSSAVTLAQFFHALLAVLAIIERSEPWNRDTPPDPKLAEIHKVVTAALKDL